MALEGNTPSSAAREAAPPPPPRIYSVPRRYDLATLFAVSLAYALLFGFLRAVGAPPVVFVIVAGFVTLVGLSQALLFRGKAPRAASVVCGMAVFLAVHVRYMAAVAFQYPGGLPVLVGVVPFTVLLPGAMFGYVAGVLVGGVFLVADAVRSGLRACVSHRAANAGDEGRTEGSSPPAE